MSSKEKEGWTFNRHKSSHFVAAVYRLSKIVPYVLSKHKPRVVELDTFSAVEGEQSQYEATQKLEKNEYEMLGLNRMVPKRVAYKEFFDTPDEFEDVVSKKHSQTESSWDETTDDLLDGFLNLISPKVDEDDWDIGISDPLSVDYHTPNEPEIEEDEILYIGNPSFDNRKKKTSPNSSKVPNSGLDSLGTTDSKRPNRNSSCLMLSQQKNMVLHSVDLPTSPQTHKTGRPTHHTCHTQSQSESANQPIAQSFSRSRSKVHTNLDKASTSLMPGTHSRAVTEYHFASLKKRAHSNNTKHRPTKICIAQTILRNETSKPVAHNQTNASHDIIDDSHQPKQLNPTLKHQKDRPTGRVSPGTKVGRCPAETPRSGGQKLTQSPIHETSHSVGRNLTGTQSNPSNNRMCKKGTVVMESRQKISQSTNPSIQDTKNENNSKSSRKRPLILLKDVTSSKHSKYSASLKSSQCTNSSEHEAETKSYSKNSRKQAFTSMEDVTTSDTFEQRTSFLKSSQNTVHESENRSHSRSRRKRSLTAIKDSKCTNSNVCEVKNQTCHPIYSDSAVGMRLRSCDKKMVEKGHQTLAVAVVLNRMEM